MNITKRGIVTTIATTTALVVVGGMAYAAWQTTATEAGASAGHAASKQNVVISEVTAPTNLYPLQVTSATEPIGNVSFKVTNPNPYPVALSNASVTGVVCGTTAVPGFTFGTPTYVDPARTAPNATTPSAGTVTIPVTAVPDLPEACNNAAVNFAVTVTATSK